MSDSINLNESLAGFNTTSLFEPTEQTNANEAAQARGGRGLLRAALARRGRARAAVLVNISQRAREVRAARQAEEAEEPAQAREQAPPDRATMRQQFRQAIEAFRNVNQPAQAAGGDATRRGAAFAVGRTQGAEQGARGGGAAAANRGFQAGAQPAIVAGREPLRLDGVRMAASFEQTALGSALRGNRPPAAQAAGPANRGNLTQVAARNTGPGADFGPAGRTALAGNRLNTPDRLEFGAAAAPAQRGFGAADQPERGPMARVQTRQTNPASNLLNTDQRSPLGADRIALATGNVGPNQLERQPIIERVELGRAEENNAALRAGVGTDNIRNPAGVNQPGNPGAAPDLNANNQIFNTAETPLDRGNAAQGQEQGDRAGLRRNVQVQGAPIEPMQAPPAPQEANPADRLAGAAGEPGGGIGANARPAAAPGPGVPPPANPAGGGQPDLLRVEPPARQQVGQGGPVGPAGADVLAGVAPEDQPVNPAPPTPEPPETPAEAAVALNTPPAEAADEALRANVPAPILQPPEAEGAGRTPPGVAANRVSRADFTPPAAAAPGVAAPQETGAANPPPGEPVGAAEPLRAAVPVEGEEEPGPAAVPAGAAEGGPRAGLAEAPANEEGPAAAAGEPPAGPAERQPTGEEQQATRAVAAYELQQLENRTNEPNEGRTVTELFIR